MQLILKQDVENLGFTDDVVEVKPGYGRNFLIPQGKAILATPLNVLNVISSYSLTVCHANSLFNSAIFLFFKF